MAASWRISQITTSTTVIDAGGWEPPGWPPVTVFDVTGDIMLSTVHDRKLCKQEPCPFHNPSAHHMRDWTMTVEQPMVLRYCKHMQTHPDPDSRLFARRNGLNWDEQHEARCDGCCAP